MVSTSKNIKIFLNYFVGPLLFIWLSVSIYHQVKNQPDLATSLSGFQHLRHSQIWRLGVILILMMVNWAVEARKFQVLLQPVEQVSRNKALRAILTGIAFSISTPNRIGEYPGKLLLLQRGNRFKALSLLIAGNMSQLLVTLIAGFGGLIFLSSVDDAVTSVLHTRSYFQWMKIGVYGTGAIACIALIAYFRLGSVIKMIQKFPVFRKGIEHIRVLNSMSHTILLRVLMLSVMRYLIFAGQYVLLLQFMQVDIPVWQTFWLICIVYLILSVIPTIAFAEMGIRGQISLELFGLYSGNRFGIIAASIGIWGINLLIPAIIGSLLVFRIKIFSSK